jgi:chorismate mutase
MTPEEAEAQAQAKLEEYRLLIDDVDRRIVALLNERTKVVEDIGRVKLEAHLPVYETKREDLVFANITAANHGPLTTQAVRGIFERIIDASRSIQRLRMMQKPPEEPKC